MNSHNDWEKVSLKSLSTYVPFNQVTVIDKVEEVALRQIVLVCSSNLVSHCDHLKTKFCPLKRNLDQF